MGHQLPGQTPEGSLIAEAAKASGQSVRALAANAGMSDTRWRQVVKGTQPGPAGEPIPARASAVSLARMAIAVGVTPGQLEEAGREDAAEQQRGIMNRAAVSRRDEVDEIELVAASRSMPTKQKLETIRTILILRQQLEAEEAQAREEASASNAEASVEQS